MIVCLIACGVAYEYERIFLFTDDYGYVYLLVAKS